MDKIFNYNINNGFYWSEVNLKGEKKYYIEGYASTIDKDKAGEVIDIKAQQDLLNQILNENITLDIEHQEWYDDDGNILQKPKNTLIPVAKIVHAELKEKGVWVKAEINKHIPSFRSVWNSIKDGFLKAFSIAFYPIEQVNKVISRLNLVNITLTGSPVNPNATFNVAMKSAKAYLDTNNIKEEDKMAKDEKIEDSKLKHEESEEKVEEQPQPQEEKVEEQPQEPQEEVKKVEEEPEVEVEEKVEVNEEQPKEVNYASEVVEELRAEVKALKEEHAKLKAELEKPVMKSIKDEAPEVPKGEEFKYISPLKMVR